MNPDIQIKGRRCYPIGLKLSCPGPRGVMSKFPEHLPLRNTASSHFRIHQNVIISVPKF